MRYRYGYRKNIITKRRVLTLLICSLVFVMSLGYAALSQYLEIEGFAVIENQWDVKVISVTNTATNNGTSTGSNFVGNTVTLHSNLPNSNSTVTYTITVENQGNLDGKLLSIEEIEDHNENITYTVTYPKDEEGNTLIAAGETQEITVVVKYSNTNTTDPTKSIMLTFNYVEDENSSSGGDPSKYLVTHILANNTAQSDKKLDFSKTSQENRSHQV